MNARALGDLWPDRNRWLLPAPAAAYALWSLPLREHHLRHAAQMVKATGLAIVGIALTTTGSILEPAVGRGGAQPPWGWQAVIAAAGCGLVA